MVRGQGWAAHLLRRTCCSPGRGALCTAPLAAHTLSGRHVPFSLASGCLHTNAGEEAPTRTRLPRLPGGPGSGPCLARALRNWREKHEALRPAPQHPGQPFTEPGPARDQLGTVGVLE